MPRVHSPSAAGFTLLEAIVALTIIGLALVPMITFIAQSADALERAADSNERSFTKQAAIALMEPINPLAEAKGQLDLDRNVAISWDSEEVVPANTTPLVGTGLATFRVGFYVMHIHLTRRDTGPWFDFDMRKTGYDRFAATVPYGLNN